MSFDEERVAPTSVSELLNQVDVIENALPKRLKQCAVYLKRNVHLVAVSTVADMAAGADVAPSAFVRFCQTLGFSGYLPMQRLFRADYAQSRPDYSERLARIGEEGPSDLASLIGQFARAGKQSLETLEAGLDAHHLQRAATRLSEARTIHLVGLRRAFPIVCMMAYLLDKMEVPCVLHQSAGHIVGDHAIQPGDVVFAVTFSPFSPETIEIAAAAADRHVAVVALTDTADCPLRAVAVETLIAREAEVGAFRVPTAAATLATALSVSIGTLRKNDH